MTPTPTLILFVALFWTLPAGAAVLTYRARNRSDETVKASVQRTPETGFGQVLLGPDA